MSLPFSLPQDDLWNYLAKAAKPIFLYGMGDGADKVLSVLSSRGIAVQGVFASDEFGPRAQLPRVSGAALQ